MAAAVSVDGSLAPNEGFALPGGRGLPSTAWCGLHLPKPCYPFSGRASPDDWRPCTSEGSLPSPPLAPPNFSRKQCPCGCPSCQLSPQSPLWEGPSPPWLGRWGHRGTAATGLGAHFLVDLFVVVVRKEGKCDEKPTSRVRAPGPPCPEVLHPLAWSGQPVAALAREQRTGRVSEDPRVGCVTGHGQWAHHPASPARLASGSGN